MFLVKLFIADTWCGNLSL